MRTSLLCCFGLVLALLFGGAAWTEASADTAPASPSDSNEKGVKEEKKLDAGKTSGLTRYDLGLWTLVVFGLLMILLGKFAWKPIMAGLQKREDSIASHHVAAEEARLQAEKLLAEVKAQRAKGNEEIVALLAEARRDADSYRETERTRAAADIQADRDRLKREIETARDQALKELWEKTVQLAALVSTKTLGRVVTTDDHHRLVDESLVELQQQINQRKA